MFANKKRHILASAIQVTGMTVLLAGLTACGGSSSDDSAAIEGQVPSEPGTVVRGKTEKDQSVFTAQAPRLLMVQFVDANTGLPVEDVTATLYAPVPEGGQGDLREIRFGSEEGSNDQMRTLRAENGLLNLPFTDLLTEGGGEAKQLRIQATASGYFSGGTTVHVEPEGEFDTVTVPLVSKSEAPEGVTMGAKEIMADNGVPTEAIDLPVGDGGFSLPGNAVLKDSEGNLLSGDVTVEVALFDPAEDDALAAFPGGFAVGPDTTRLNEEDDAEGNFLSAGFMAVDIVDSQGRKAHELGEDAILRFPVDSSALNPDTGEALKAGDTVSVWSRDETTGAWNEEDQDEGEDGSSVIHEDEEGNLYVEVSTNHLSYWNLDWHYSAKCHRPVKFTDEGGVALAEMPLTGIDLSVKITPQDDDRYYGSSRTLNMLDVENTIANTPNSSKFMLELQPMIRGETVGDAVQVKEDTKTESQGYYQSCDDVFVAVNPEKFPETSTITASAYITAPQTLTYWEVDRLILEANDVNSAEELKWEDGGDKWEDRLEILNETHPGSNPENTSYYGGSSQVYNIRANRFRFSDIYQKLLDRELLTRTEIATVQQVLKTRFLLEDATFYYTFRADEGGSLYRSLTMQEGEVEVPVLGKGWAYGTVYANVAPEGESAKWVSASASTYVDPKEDAELEIAFTDAAAIAEIFSAMLENNKVTSDDNDEFQ